MTVQEAINKESDMGGFDLMKEGLAQQQAYLDMTAPKHDAHVNEHFHRKAFGDNYKSLMFSQEQISANLVAQAAENRAKGWSND